MDLWGVAGTVADENPIERELREANERLILAAIREQELADRAQHEAAQRTAIIEQLQAGVLLLDPAMVIHVMNQSARDLFGVSVGPGTRVDALGVTFVNTLGEPLALADTPFQQMFTTESLRAREIVLIRADGGRRQVSIGASSLRDRSGKVVSAVAVLHDVTELRELERMREEYLALLSHDLRSPLSGVSLFSGLLERVLAAKGMETEAGNARRILKSSELLSALIEDLVESTRLEAGGFTLQRELIDFRTLVDEVCESVAASAPDRVQVSCPASLPFSADALRIKRALTNLVSNALKYSPPDTPVAVSCRRTEEGLTVSVQDAGPGIAPAHRPHIFEKYYRASGTKRAEGIGLGLYIVRLIVESHGGHVRLESEVGRGSTFSFTLPDPDGASAGR